MKSINRDRLIYLIDQLIKAGPLYRSKFEKLQLDELFVDVYFDFLRPEMHNTKMILKITRKSWAPFIKLDILNSIRDKIK